MKKVKIYFKFLLILQMIISFACTKDSVDEPANLSIKDDDKIVNVAQVATNKTIIVDTNYKDWTVTSNQEWCQVAKNTQNGNYIDITVTANDNFNVRSCEISVVASNVSEKIIVNQLGTEPTILVNTKNKRVDYKSQSFEVIVTTNIAEIEIICDKEWLSVSSLKNQPIEPVDITYQVNVSELPDDVEGRNTIVKFKQVDGDAEDAVNVVQTITLEDDYVPGPTDSFETDKKLNVIAATLTPENKYQSGANIERTIDGDYNTEYHSPWAGMPEQTSITFEYTLDEAGVSIANYIVLHPRTSGFNGVIADVTVYATTAANPTYTKICDAHQNRTHAPFVINFPAPLLQPRKIKIEVKDAYTHDGNYYVSLCEFEVYENRAINAIESDKQYFTDLSFSELKSSVTLDDIKNIENPFIQNLAAYLYTGNYKKDFRVGSYKAYRPIEELETELKIKQFSQFENPTGIYFTKDEEAIVFVDNIQGQKVELRVTDFGPDKADHIYNLVEGLNVLKMKGAGLAYVSYYSTDYESLQEVKVHVATGNVNGYYDKSIHTNEQAVEMLNSAKGHIFDLVGERVHLAYSISDLKTHANGQLFDLIDIYDDLIKEEQKMQGWMKYDRLPSNHVLGRVMYSGYMHADALGAAFHTNTMDKLANANSTKQDNWGVSHEFSHVHQTRPGMMWVGTTEVTVNIHSAWNQYRHTPNHLRLEHEKVWGVVGGRYNGYFKSALIWNHEYGLQVNDIADYKINDNNRWGGDLFISAIPFWQLQLYYHVAGDKPYFYADIYEKVRQTDETGLSQGQLQLNFVKNACDAVEEDLSDFFIANGMLQTVDKMFGDYSSKQKTITQSMIDETVAYCQQYPKPATNCIYYISANSVDAYKNKLNVQGSFNHGISGTTEKTIDHQTWKNVVVFETYAGDELKEIALVGTGDATCNSTQVKYPEGSTRIEAVQWDGQRILVYGAR